ncbi:pentapeptide repeat-containing protein [Nocardia sp. NRRL S-836]|uniref:pentapeptide repeat-containing protein n=1 Tax=Nocardia sp. NRRL S-836 TaxID=1519492 RepID=UPI0006AE2C7E|nr:pentapeptide repeat-containing protein [Nocardia sp. NRRL S-836]
MLVIVLPVLASAAAAIVVLFTKLAPSTPPDRLDTVRTGLAVAAGIGALITLALALRRQQATEHDATERRLTELYVKAVDQLGSDKPAVRHGGLYALERVAQDNPGHRQTIVDVICAYLRGPFTLPSRTGTPRLGGLRAPSRPGRAGLVARPTAKPPSAVSHDDTRQEREVRLTAQRILRDHLQPRTRTRTWYRWFPRPRQTFWPDIDLDLTDATLIDLDFAYTTVRTAQFKRAKFTGDAGFDRAQFVGDAGFDEAQFDGRAGFDKAQFDGHAGFYGVRFAGDAEFYNTRFDGAARFDQAQFDAAWFNEAQFADDTVFNKAQFAGIARFDRAQFASVAEFGEARFSSIVRFDTAQFASVAGFSEARFDGDAGFIEARFAGAWFDKAQFASVAEFDKARFFGIAEFNEARFDGAAGFDKAQFDAARFNEAQFASVARFSNARFFSSFVWFDRAQFAGDARFDEAQFSHTVPEEVKPYLRPSSDTPQQDPSDNPDPSA